MKLNRKNNKKGFTLAELLVVVAIIAVLAAISVPVFSNQIERSREAADVANIREAYAAVVGEGVAENTTKSSLSLIGITYKNDSANDCKKWSKSIKLTQKADGWQDAANLQAIQDIGIDEDDISGKPEEGKGVTVTYCSYNNGSPSKVSLTFGSYVDNQDDGGDDDDDDDDGGGNGGNGGTSTVSEDLEKEDADLTAIVNGFSTLMTAYNTGLKTEEALSAAGLSNVTYSYDESWLRDEWCMTINLTQTANGWQSQVNANTIAANDIDETCEPIANGTATLYFHVDYNGIDKTVDYNYSE